MTTFKNVSHIKTPSIYVIAFINTFINTFVNTFINIDSFVLNYIYMHKFEDPEHFVMRPFIYYELFFFLLVFYSNIMLEY